MGGLIYQLDPSVIPTREELTCRRSPRGSAAFSGRVLAGEVLDGGPCDDVAVDVEAGAVAGAVPGSFSGVEGEPAAEMGAVGGYGVQDAAGVAVAGDGLAVEGD